MRRGLLFVFSLCGCCLVALAQDFSTYVAAQDGTKIALDVYLPKPDDGPRKSPALLELTRYWRSSEHMVTRRPINALSSLDRYLLGRGYALIKVDVRGSGASFGSRQAEYGPQEVRDGYDVVEWVVSQPWSNGRVGAFGTSYTGTTAELLAAVEHPAVRAVVPGWSDFDVYTSPVRPYGLMASKLIERWSAMVGWLDDNNVHKIGRSVRRVAADGDGRLLQQAVAEHAANADVFAAVSALDFRDTPMGSGEASMADCSSLFWKNQIEESGVAMLVFASWLDAGTAQGALQRFRHYDNLQKLVILASSHGGMHHASPYTVSDRPAAPVPSPRELAEMRADFFDHYLEGADNGVSDWPAVRYYNMGEEAMHTSDVWPPKGTVERHYYLRAGGVLSAQPPESDDGADTYAVDFSVSTGKSNRWMTQMGEPVLRLDDRGAMDEKMLTYTTPPLESELQITGTPVVTLHVASDHRDGAFLVYLEDVDADGRSRYLTEGGLRALHRALSTNPHHEQLTPYHSFARDAAAPMVPGERAELVFELLPTSVLVRAGHSLRVAIAGADADSFDRVPAEGEPTITLVRSRAHASSVVLPVVER